MPKNKLQEVIFTILMVFVMVYAMVCYNIALNTGGIVQGMSGSPILQNGKLVGAVTHVFVDDPTKGYGIFCENMVRFGQVGS